MVGIYKDCVYAMVLKVIGSNMRCWMFGNDMVSYSLLTAGNNITVTHYLNNILLFQK